MHILGTNVARSLALLLSSATAVAGTTLFVDDSAPLGGDGTTWNSAYRFLQDALADASQGGVIQIRVGQGTYQPDQDDNNPGGSGLREATFQLVEGVDLVGGYAGFGAGDPDARDVDLYETILTGDLLGNDRPDFANMEENSFHVTAGGGVSDLASIDGFTIVSGNANGAAGIDDRGGGLSAINGGPSVIACTFIGNRGDAGGGGMHVTGATTIDVTGCTFLQNAGLQGAGAAFHTIPDANITDCTFTANEGNPEHAGQGSGAGTFLSQTIATFVDCTWTANRAGVGGGVTAGNFNQSYTNCLFESNFALTRGGALASGGTATIVNCTFTDNRGGSGGGGAISISAPATIDDSTFTLNRSIIGAAIINDGAGLLQATNCDFSDNYEASRGGALYVADTSATFLTDCTFTNNTATIGGNSARGGAIYSDDTQVLLCITDVVFDGNTSSDGGAIYSDRSSPTLENCVFIDNTGDLDGGAIYGFLGNPDFVGCDFINNSAGSAAGGAHGGAVNLDRSNGSFVDCRFIGNIAVDANGAGTGGAVRNIDGQPFFANCLFTGNQAGQFPLGAGGAIASVFVNFPASSFLTTINCVVANNATPQVGGGIILSGDTDNPSVVTNCILWGNSDGGGQDESANLHLTAGADVSVNYTCIQGLTGALGGVGNIGDDPLFFDADGLDDIVGTEDDNLRLLACSPCIDAGDNDAVPVGILTDLDGNPRFIDDPETADTGNGTPPIVDMGPYEFVPPACIEDLDNNCQVGASDLLLLLALWGTDPGGPPDFDCSGAVGAGDLLRLLAAWGNCACAVGPPPPSLQDELDDACLTQDDWDEFMDVMTDPESSQADKDRYLCWMTHYFDNCSKCICIGASGCPGPDPFS